MTATVALIAALLAAQAAVRVVLAVKSAAIPDVLSGKDLCRATHCRRPVVPCSRSLGSRSRSVRGRRVRWAVVVGGRGRAAGRRCRRAADAPRGDGCASHLVRPRGVQVVAQHGGRAQGGRGPARRRRWVCRRSRCCGTSSGDSAVHVRALREEPRGGWRCATVALAITGGGGLLGGALASFSPRSGRIASRRSACCWRRWSCLGRDLVFGGARIDGGLRRDALRRVLSSSWARSRPTRSCSRRCQTTSEAGPSRSSTSRTTSASSSRDDPLGGLDRETTCADPSILIVSGVVFLGLTALVAAWARRIRGGSHRRTTWSRSTVCAGFRLSPSRPRRALRPLPGAQPTGGAS